MRLKNKVAVVTGASRGIGKTIAKAYAREGAKVVVTARTEKPEDSKVPGTIHDTVRQIREAGGEATAIRCDISQESSVNDMVRQAVDAYGPIDILVNNAGVRVDNFVWDVPLKRWELLMRVNFWGPVYAVRAVVPSMIERRTGNIINITSHGATGRSPKNTIYGTTKAALDRMTIGLATEVKQYGIAVNSMGPGLVVTEGALLFSPGKSSWAGWDDVEIVAEPAVWLAMQTAETYSGNVVHAPDYRKLWP
ncbi:MAG: SDR family NAD(P)-dependent oxidoreductase [Chloroflexi bacterium]|nr:SDR family NAD(P)-dependent oxidoreductase [Chloroflexota bacterium]